MKRRGFLARIASLPALAAMSWLAACTRNAPMVVGIMPWIGFETLYLAREFGWLPPQVHWVEGAYSGEMRAALIDGRIAAACLTLDETLVVRAAGVPLVVALVFDVSAGADVVMARPGITTVAGLAGRRIGLEQSAQGVLMLSRALAAGGLTTAQVTLRELPPHRQLDAWRAGEVDAVVTFEPTASLLQREGARRLFDSRQTPDAIFDVLVVRRDHAQGANAIIEALLAAHFRGLRHLHDNRQDAIYRIAGREKIIPTEVRRILGGIVQPSLDANRRYLGGQDGRLDAAARALSQLMVDHGLLARADDLDGLFSDEWLPHEPT